MFVYSVLLALLKYPKFYRRNQTPTLLFNTLCINKMAFSQAIWFMWLLISVFVVLLCLKLDSVKDTAMYTADWFAIFSPLFVAHLCQFCITCMQIHRGRNMRYGRNTVIQNLIYLGYIFLLVTFKILLCIRLNSNPMNLFVVFIPLWLYLFVFVIRCIYTLFKSTSCLTRYCSG